MHRRDPRPRLFIRLGKVPADTKSSERNFGFGGHLKWNPGILRAVNSTAKKRKSCEYSKLSWILVTRQ